MSDLLGRARAAHQRHDWPLARERYRAAATDGELPVDDLFRLSDSAWWMGHNDEALDVAEQAYRRCMHGDRPREAALAAVSVATNLYLRGDEVMGSGWMSRARRLLEDEPEGPEHGYVLYIVEVESALGGGIATIPAEDFDALIASARRVREMGRRHGDHDLVAAGLLGEGRALVKRGRVAEGLAMLDEVMLAVVSKNLRPDLAGNLYCHLMSAAHELGDIRRSVDWTEATGRWLVSLPAAVLFTGICRVHRSQVHQFKGAWEQAELEAVLVCEELTDIQPATAAEGHYQIGEIRRLRGDLGAAEASYRLAHGLGRDPQPGLALLRLAQGGIPAAAASIRAALIAATGDRLARARLCSAQVEIALAASEVDVARGACAELAEIADTYASSGLHAVACHAQAALLAATTGPEEALPALREALRRWHDVEAPYECARVRALLAKVYADLGDADSATLEIEAAATTFDRLGAVLDATRLAALRGPPPALPDGLTEREAEVLALVAAGRTNREVAATLVISEKTVARHLSNIFTKLGLSSRTAAAAYAYEHGLTQAVLGS